MKIYHGHVCSILHRWLCPVQLGQLTSHKQVVTSGQKGTKRAYNYFILQPSTAREQDNHNHEPWGQNSSNNAISPVQLCSHNNKSNNSSRKNRKVGQFLIKVSFHCIWKNQHPKHWKQWVEIVLYQRWIRWIVWKRMNRCKSYWWYDESSKGQILICVFFCMTVSLIMFVAYYGWKFDFKSHSQNTGLARCKRCK